MITSAVSYNTTLHVTVYTYLAEKHITVSLVKFVWPGEKKCNRSILFRLDIIYYSRRIEEGWYVYTRIYLYKVYGDVK